MVAMIIRHREEEVSPGDLRTLIIGHWERGLKAINADAGGGSVVDRIAQDVLGKRAEDQGGLDGSATRDRVAAALGREFGRLPVEVRRLLAMVGRFDLGRARIAASRMIDEVNAGDGSARVSESQAMKVLNSWGLNRLGMTAADSETMRTIFGSRDGAGLNTLDKGSVHFLARLGLAVVLENDLGEEVALPSAQAAALGPESWLQ